MKEQDILTVPLIEGTDGIRKMSKSFGNYIGIMEKSSEMFGKLMSIPDALIPKYFTLLTDLNPPKQLSPYHAKLLLAETIVGMYHSEKDAAKAKENFIKIFSKGETPAEIPELKVNRNATILEALRASGIPSNSEAMRLVTQGAVQINGVVANNPRETLREGNVLKVGKKKFFRIRHT